MVGGTQPYQHQTMMNASHDSKHHFYRYYTIETGTNPNQERASREKPDRVASARSGRAAPPWKWAVKLIHLAIGHRRPIGVVDKAAVIGYLG